MTEKLKKFTGRQPPNTKFDRIRQLPWKAISHLARSNRSLDHEGVPDYYIYICMSISTIPGLIWTVIDLRSGLTLSNIPRKTAALLFYEYSVWLIRKLSLNEILLFKSHFDMFDGAEQWNKYWVASYAKHFHKYQTSANIPYLCASLYFFLEYTSSPLL